MEDTEVFKSEVFSMYPTRHEVILFVVPKVITPSNICCRMQERVQKDGLAVARLVCRASK